MAASGPEVCATDVEATTTLWQDTLHRNVNVLVSSDVLWQAQSLMLHVSIGYCKVWQWGGACMWSHFPHWSGRTERSSSSGKQQTAPITMTTEIHAVILARVHLVHLPGTETWHIIPHLEVLPRQRPGDFPQHSVNMFHYRLFRNGCQYCEISSAGLWGLPTVECLGQGSVPNWLLKRRPPRSIHSPPTKPS